MNSLSDSFEKIIYHFDFKTVQSLMKRFGLSLDRGNSVPTIREIKNHCRNLLNLMVEGNKNINRNEFGVYLKDDILGLVFTINYGDFENPELSGNIIVKTEYQKIR